MYHEQETAEEFPYLYFLRTRAHHSNGITCLIPETEPDRDKHLSTSHGCCRHFQPLSGQTSEFDECGNNSFIFMRLNMTEKNRSLFQHIGLSFWRKTFKKCLSPCVPLSHSSLTPVCWVTLNPFCFTECHIIYRGNLFTLPLRAKPTQAYKAGNQLR